MEGLQGDTAPKAELKRSAGLGNSDMTLHGGLEALHPAVRDSGNNGSNNNNKTRGPGAHFLSEIDKEA